MNNALHDDYGSEQKSNNQDRIAKCVNFNVSKEKLDKDKLTPSLLQQTKNSFKVSIIPQKQTKEIDELLQNNIKKRADDLYQEVYSSTSMYAEDTQSYNLNDGVIKPPTLIEGLSSITVGTDCSGLDAPIIALIAAGIDHKHIFSAETDQHCVDTINANSAPEILYNDLMNRDNS